MAHYPFADDLNSMSEVIAPPTPSREQNVEDSIVNQQNVLGHDDIDSAREEDDADDDQWVSRLADPYSEASAFCGMGDAGRKRLATRIYKETCFGKAGMRFSELTGALKVSHDILLTEITFSNTVNHICLQNLGLHRLYTNFIANHDEAVERVRARWHAHEQLPSGDATVSITLWNDIVHKCILLYQHKKYRVRMALLKKQVPLQTTCSPAGRMDVEEGDNFESDDADRSDDVDGHRSGYRFDESSLSEGDVLDRESGSQTHAKPARRADSPKRLFGQRMASGHSRATAVSRIRTQVQRDKKNFYVQKAKERESVLQSLAQRRADAYLSGRPLSAPPSAVCGGGGARVSLKKPDAGELSRGCVAVDIADAFLNGPVGRELLGGHPLAATVPSSRSSGTRVTLNSNIARREQEKEDEAESRKMLFGSDEQRGVWRAARGGWVADFGAPHTHALFTGADPLSTTYINTGEKPWKHYQGGATSRAAAATTSVKPAAMTNDTASRVVRETAKTSDAHADDVLDDELPSASLARAARLPYDDDADDFLSDGSTGHFDVSLTAATSAPAAAKTVDTSSYGYFDFPDDSDESISVN